MPKYATVAEKVIFERNSFRGFLIEYLPKRYSVGKGEVISPENRHSPELDVIIYDQLRCPILLRSPSHGVYPIESVYGAISMKSHLDHNELDDAYQNIAAFKALQIKGSFGHQIGPGSTVGLASPTPVTGVVAYQANRSLDAVANQVRALDERLADIQLRPDFVAVIGRGIVAPRVPLRGEFNSFELPPDSAHLVDIRKTGRHTLLRLYMQILRELNTLTLRDLDLSVYDRMPRIVGPYRVNYHDRFIKLSSDNSMEQRVCRLNELALRTIVNNSIAVTGRQHYSNRFGEIPSGLERYVDLNAAIYEYNPKGHPAMSSLGLSNADPVRVFNIAEIQIDGKPYAVDMNALHDEFFDENPDLTVDELTSM